MRRRRLQALEPAAPKHEPSKPAPSKRLKARTLTGRSEAQDAGALAHQALQRAHYTEHRIAFDPFDALAKSREADAERKEGLALLAPPEGTVLKSGGEAILNDTGPGKGLTTEQVSLEIALIDTLEHPTMIGLGASQLRQEAVQRLGILQPALDAAETVQAGNSLEKMLSHQLTACHFTAMNLLQRAIEGNCLLHDSPDAPFVTRYTNAAARMMDTYQAGMLALLKFKTGGKQTVVVQHVHVSEGGQAVIAGNVTKDGGSGTGGGTSK